MLGSMKRRGIALLTALVVAGAALPAAAQVYKYTKKDGTVVYTDKLSDLPPERRAYYNAKEKKAEEKRRRARKRMTEEERRAADLEAQRKRILEQELAEEARRKQLQAIDEALAAYRKEKREREQAKAYWQEKLAKAKTDLREALAAYREALEEYESLAIQPNFSLFPGQRARLEELRTKLPKLEQAVDEANLYLVEILPEEARKAGVPPGWLR